MKEFPKQIFVQIDGEGDEAYLAANDNVADCDPDSDRGHDVGIYELKSVARIEDTRTVVPVEG